jgi:hypothetical protein
MSSSSVVIVDQLEETIFYGLFYDKLYEIRCLAAFLEGHQGRSWQKCNPASFWDEGAKASSSILQNGYSDLVRQRLATAIKSWVSCIHSQVVR